MSIRGDIERLLKVEREEELIRVIESLKHKENYLICYWASNCLYFKFSIVDRAIELLNQSIKLNDRFFASYWLYGIIKYDLREYESAYEYFKRATELNPDSIFLPNYLYLALWNMKRDEAEEFFEESFPIEDPQFLVRWLISIEKRIRPFGRLLPSVSIYDRGTSIYNLYRRFNKRFLELSLWMLLKKKKIDFVTLLDRLELLEEYVYSEEELFKILKRIERSRIKEETKRLTLIELYLKLNEIERVRSLLNFSNELQFSNEDLFFINKYRLILSFSEGSELEESLNRLEESVKGLDEAFYLEFLYLKGLYYLFKKEEDKAKELLLKVVEELPLLPYHRYNQWRRWIRR